MRLADNPALLAAADSGRPVVPCFVTDDAQSEAGWALGGAAGLWLHDSLAVLGQELLVGSGSQLVLRDGVGGTVAAVMVLAQDCGATAVYFNR